MVGLPRNTQFSPAPRASARGLRPEGQQAKSAGVRAGAPSLPEPGDCAPWTGNGVFRRKTTTTSKAPTSPLDAWFTQVADDHRRLADHFDRPVELYDLERAW